MRQHLSGGRPGPGILLLSTRLRPDHDHFIAHKLVDLALDLMNYVRDLPKVFAQQRAQPLVSKAFCQPGGVPQVHEHEHRMYFPRATISAEDEANKIASPDQQHDLGSRRGEEGEQRGEGEIAEKQRSGDELRQTARVAAVSTGRWLDGQHQGQRGRHQRRIEECPRQQAKREGMLPEALLEDCALNRSGREAKHQPNRAGFRILDECARVEQRVVQQAKQDAGCSEGSESLQRRARPPGHAPDPIAPLPLRHIIRESHL